MKRFALAIVGLALSVSGSGCCGCLSHMFHGGGGGYGGGCNPCGQVAPMGGCPGGACGYGPSGYPMGYAAPAGATAMYPAYGNAPMFASVANNPPL